MATRRTIAQSSAGPYRRPLARPRVTPLGSMVRIARHARGMTQAGLACACGLSRQSICAIESGDTRSVRALTLQALAAALDLRLLDVLVAALEVDDPRREVGATR